MKIQNILILIALQIINTVAIANNKDSTYQAIRQTYITDKSHNLSVALFNRNPNNQLEIRGRNNIVYNPNDANTQGIRIQHKWLGFSLGYSSGFLQQKDRGKTNEIDIHLFGYGKKNIFDLYFVGYNGFYIENYRRNDSLRKNFNEFPLLPDMKSARTGISYLHIFNHKKFSLQASFLQNEIQRKSSGSFLAGTAISYMNFRNPHRNITLLDNTFKEEYLSDGHFWGVSLLAGYGHTFVYKNLYVTLVPILGITAQQQNIEYGVPESNRVDRQLGIRTIGRFSVGYNSDRFFVAVTGTNDTYNQSLSNKVTLINQISELRAIVGYRFITKGYVKKVSDLMDKIYTR